MDTQTADYNIRYILPDEMLRFYSEVDFEHITYIQKCKELINSIPIEDLKNIFTLSSSRYDTPTNLNHGTIHIITIKI